MRTMAIAATLLSFALVGSASAQQVATNPVTGAATGAAAGAAQGAAAAGPVGALVGAPLGLADGVHRHGRARANVDSALARRWQRARAPRTHRRA